MASKSNNGEYYTSFKKRTQVKMHKLTDIMNGNSKTLVVIWDTDAPVK